MSNHGRSIVLYSCPKSSTFEFFVFLPYILKCGTRRFHFVSHADVHHDFDLWFSSQLNKNFKTQVSSQILRYYKTQITAKIGKEKRGRKRTKRRNYLVRLPNTSENQEMENDQIFLVNLISLTALRVLKSNNFSNGAFRKV